MACEHWAWGRGLSASTPQPPKGSEEDPGVPPLLPLPSLVRNTSACPHWPPRGHKGSGFLRASVGPALVSAPQSQCHLKAPRTRFSG